MNKVPVVDLLGGKDLSDKALASIAGQVGEALEHVGFFVIANCGTAPGLADQTREICRQFFELPEEQKLRDRTPATGRPQGYLPLGAVALASTYANGKGPPDLKESYTVRPDDAGMFRWPQIPREFRSIVHAYYQAVDAIGRTLLRVFAEALKLDREFFIEKYAGHQSALQIIHYPSQTVPPLPGQLRSGAHTDYGVITILAIQEKDAAGGLQVRMKDGSWADVVAPADSLIINIGDLMMRWTNDFWLSNVHRVINPSIDTAMGSGRISIAFFFNPKSDIIVECIPTCVGGGDKPRYAPVTVEEYLLSKIRQSAPSPTAE
ncbi:MAG: 2OG-Fe(II) oxygenase [Proteobacteria bacterium]|nr:MAG: 2OG-Fe(II) oxygenase [Pseudomonadota bacterium]